MILCIAALIGSVIEGISPLALNQAPRLLAIALTSGLVASFIAFGDRALAGLVNGICIATFSSFLTKVQAPPHFIGAYVFGVIGGTLIQSYFLLVLPLSLIAIIAAVLTGHWDCAAVGVVTFILSWLLLITSQKVASELWSPLRNYLTHTGLMQLFAFFIGYCLIIVLFALIYTSAHYWSPDTAFKSPILQQSDLTFGFFFYFSTLTIAGVSYGEVMPFHHVTRALVSLEMIIGTVWLVVYFAFLMKSVSGEKPPSVS